MENHNPEDNQIAKQPDKDLNGLVKPDASPAIKVNTNEAEQNPQSQESTKSIIPASNTAKFFEKLNNYFTWFIRFLIFVFTIVILIFTAKLENLDLGRRLFVPGLPGVIPTDSDGQIKIILGQDIDWPPYAYLGVPDEAEFTVEGFGKDFAVGMAAMNDKKCRFEIIPVQADWGDCWDASRPGKGLKNGDYHACMTYTNTNGVRNRFLEFSWSILKQNKPAGLLVRLDASGNPSHSPKSNFEGLKVADVKGWAPTIDGFDFSFNNCTGDRFEKFLMESTPDTYTTDDTLSTYTKANDIALAMLLDSKIDAVWIYADQAKNYDCANFAGTPSWDCTMWAKFGTSFAYLHTGIWEHARNGTTLTMSKKGSGIPDLINPCIEKFMNTPMYKEICDKHGVTNMCYPNRFFTDDEKTEPKKKYNEMATSEHSLSCSNGYCNCDS